MEIKLKFNDKEKHFLYRGLSIILSITFIITGTYAIAYFEKLGLLKGQLQLVTAIALHVLQWWLVMRAVFKYYRYT